MARLPMKWGHVRELECEDPDCSSCEQNWSKQVPFNYCTRDRHFLDESIEFDCDENGYSPFVISSWLTPDCEPEEEPFKQVNTYTCYDRSFESMNDVTTLGNVICNNCGDGHGPKRYYKYECRIGNGHNGLLRAEDEKAANVEMEPHIWSIVVAILLSVCIIGIIIGYLMHRNRKKKESVSKKSLLHVDNL